MVYYQTKYTPEEVGYDPLRIEAVNKHFQDLIEKKKILSANYCMARDGRTFVDAAIGKLSYQEDDTRELLPDTIQRIASITKLFTAVAIWQLVENGKLRVNQKVGEIIEEFNTPPFNEITIAHLLTHTSGLQPDPGCFENKYFLSPWELIDKDRSKTWIAAALQSGLKKEPGEEWAYCSFGFAILGEIITRVSGIRAENYIIDYIVSPCGMKDTGFDIEKKEIVERLNIPSERREKFVKEFLEGTYKREDEGSVWGQIPSTGGGMFSTAKDLCRFGTMLVQGGYIEGNRIIGRKTIEKMSTLYTGPEIKDYCWKAGGVYRAYGLGPDMRCNDASLYSKGTYFHEGAGGCCLIIDPVEKLVAAWFIPFIGDVWCPEPLYNAAAVMWSGLI
ncbi:MAG: class A beta-lactamase-related serine hydrolase [Anaerolineaceae bacterium]|nr:MAG: class A beta-lactamase-related serine hydrolase [Anaerolineaceae bacterium]